MAIDGMMEGEGLLGDRLHRQGQGVGFGFSEAPEISDLDDTVLQPGMTFSVEPGISIPGIGGVGIGNTMAVTANGCDALTPAPYFWPR